MIGYLVWNAGGWRIRYYEEEINGVRFLRAELPGIPDTARGLRLQRRALELLRRNGVSRFLNADISGTLSVPTGPLWRSLAAPLALAGLAIQGISPANALVSLRAGRVDRSVVTCCTTLATTVRALALDIPECEGLTWALQRRFGIPVLKNGGDLALCFSGTESGIDLRGDTPQPAGFSLGCPSLTLPEDCPPEPMLAYFVEQGVIHLPDIDVVAAARKTVPEVLEQPSLPV